MWQVYTVGTQNYLYTPLRRILVDGGPGKDQARKLKQTVGTIEVIFLTHAHADHYGGVPYLLKAFPSLQLFLHPQEIPFLHNPIFEPALLFGGLPPRALCHPFLLGPSNLPFQEIDPTRFPDIEFVPLPGHTPGLFGIAMGDTLFAADALFGLEIVKKYPILYHFDPEEALRTLDTVEERFTTFIPSHGSLSGKELLRANRETIERTLETILVTIASGKRSLEEILKATMTTLTAVNSLDHYFLNRSALLGYVSTLEKRGELVLQVENSEVLIQKR
ncbi:MAG: MBL fold metallo-hydrolase [Atribacterota bacterium]